MRHKEFIKEESSVSRDVKFLGNVIGKKIFKDSMSINQKLSNVKEIPYLENTFSLNINDLYEGKNNPFNIDELTISYIIYNCDSERDYFEKVYKYGNASESSFEKKSMLIVSAMIEGNMVHSFIEEIYHELTHLLQYGMGMEKKVDLYDIVVQELKNPLDKVTEAIFRLVYMTFKHEQDAFVHQFYARLRTSKDKRPFEDILQETEYGYCKKLRVTYFYGKKYENDVVNQSLDKLGMNCEKFEKRINYGITRFKNKLKNAYDKYLIDSTSQNITTELSSKFYRHKEQILETYKKRYKNLTYDDELIYKDYGNTRSIISP